MHKHQVGFPTECALTNGFTNFLNHLTGIFIAIDSKILQCRNPGLMIPLSRVFEELSQIMGCPQKWLLALLLSPSQFLKRCTQKATKWKDSTNGQHVEYDQQPDVFRN